MSPLRYSFFFEKWIFGGIKSLHNEGDKASGVRVALYSFPMNLLQTFLEADDTYVAYIQYEVLLISTLLHSATSGQKLHRVPLRSMLLTCSTHCC